jgi:2,5-diamino-6-(ribosylamino)-4(3H)-pyrimidinone 5'-phosphate reductase
MVSSLDGKANVGGKAGAIGGPTDRLLMRSLRAHADAVMVGAGTLHAEKLRLDVPANLASARASRGLKPQPLAVLVTGSGNAPIETNLLGFSPDNLLVLTSTKTEERLAALSRIGAVEIVPQGIELPGLDLTKALEILKERYDVHALLIEGGPTLNHTLIHMGLADELFLTLAPKLLGGQRLSVLTVLEGPTLLPRRSPRPELISVHVSDNELFLRYVLRSSKTGYFAALT